MQSTRRKFILPAAASLLVAACGGGGGDDSSSGPATPPSGQPPPTGTAKAVFVSGAISGFGSVIGVIVGLVLAKYTGWLPFDPICAILVACNILWAGFSLLRRSIGGLMDEADPKMDEKLRAILDRETAQRRQ